ncbi:SusD/RagB family nutrient-binding outer membrane lipoprotein [Zhouia sp. PK063]|uniref:SusD/RagB family nutrient-binding outer membrane lipoprotein n=1 Tax=Zhouia sp. PK063 TaxID=3373602 RepID=UPI0037B9B213
MKNKTYYIMLCCLYFLVNACTTNFEETNTDPNNLSQVTAGSTLNPIIYGIAVRNANQLRNLGAPIMQMFLRTDSYVNAPYLYDFTQDVGASTWNDYYKWLNNIQEMEKAAVRDEMPNYQAIALTLKAYAFSMLTDCFGDIPMEEALQAEGGEWYPKYTPQQEIYTQILADLEQANDLYDSSRGMIYVDDILFHNDVKKWQKFTNSLHLRLLLRISNKEETNAFQSITTIINNPEKYPVFTSNDDEAVLQISGVAPLLSPWDRPQDFGTFRNYSKFFIDHLNKFNDPRRAKFASVARGLNDEDYGYIGQPIDFINTPLPDSIATASGVLNSLAEEPIIIPIMSYAEVEFIKAEMALRGYINDAEMHYENGVKAAIEMWSLEVPENYFDNQYTKYNGTLSQIMLQKYYSFFFTDYQAWFEERRTGLPELPKSSSMLNNQEIPARLYYPVDAADRNHTNYQEAVDRMGGDEINVKVWWQK